MVAGGAMIRYETDARYDHKFINHFSSAAAAAAASCCIVCCEFAAWSIDLPYAIHVREQYWPESARKHIISSIAFNGATQTKVKKKDLQFSLRFFMRTKEKRDQANTNRIKSQVI